MLVADVNMSFEPFYVQYKIVVLLSRDLVCLYEIVLLVQNTLIVLFSFKKPIVLTV